MIRHGDHATGVYNGTNLAGTVIGGGTATISNSSVSTSGDDASAIVTRERRRDDGQRRGSITVTGQDSGTSRLLRTEPPHDHGNGSNGADFRHGSSIPGRRSASRSPARPSPTGTTRSARSTAVRPAGSIPAAERLRFRLRRARKRREFVRDPTRDGGTTTVSGGAVYTSGVFSHGVVTLGSGASASVTGTIITTRGNGSAGAVLDGTGSSMTAVRRQHHDLRHDRPDVRAPRPRRF